MKDPRPVLATCVSLVLSPLLVKHFGITLEPQDQIQLACYLVGGTAIAFQWFLKEVKEVLHRDPTPSGVSLTSENLLQHIDIQKLASLILIEVAKRQKNRPQPSTEQTQ